jgi:hypothetical protein
MLPGALSNSPYGFRQDLEFKWNPGTAPRPKAAIVSTADLYERSSANKSLFEKAQKAVEKRNFDSTVALLRKILENDKLDFQV